VASKWRQKSIMKVEVNSNKIYTIGANNKTAEEFFSLLKDNNVTEVVDIRLNNRSQLAGFTKYPNLEFFLREICNIRYRHDLIFAPDKETLDWYKNRKNKSEVWERYTGEFTQTMQGRNITDYIRMVYTDKDRICLLCSEETAQHCHRSLVANEFKKLLPGCEVVHL
jgi:uncharacterized protein (DUF488 family)